MQGQPLEVVGFLKECLTRWAGDRPSNVHLAVEGELSVYASVQDEATLEQVVVRLAAAAILGSWRS